MLLLHKMPAARQRHHEVGEKMSFVDDWDEHSIIYSAGIDEGSRNDEQLQTQALLASSLPTQDVFQVADLAWRGREHGGIKLIVARNEFLYIATERGKVLRWQPVTKELLDLDVTKRSDDCIHGVHLDAAGRHMVVAFSHGETVYLSMAVPKPKLLTALKGTLIESVGFERDAADGSGSRPLDFLLGTSAGVIMKVTLEGGKEKNCRQVWSAGDSSAAICSIQIESVHVKSGGGDCARIFVMAASPSRYYQFIGGPTLDALFAAHARSAPQFIELPGDLPYTQLLFNRPPGGRAQSFVWLTAPGIYCGSFAFGSSNESAIVDFKLLSHPTTQDSQHRDVQDPPAPQCMGLTEFHLLLAYGSNVYAINTLTEEQTAVVSLDHLMKGQESVRGISRDEDDRRTMFVYSAYGIFELTAHNEERDIWKHFLSHKQYDIALSHASSPEHRMTILRAQADHYYSLKKFELAASLVHCRYAKTDIPFEEIVLRIQKTADRQALMCFLVNKLADLSFRDVTQRTMICTWLTELHLAKLSSHPVGTAEFDGAMRDFEGFLTEYSGMMHRETVYELISSHGRSEALLFFAQLNKDHDRVVVHYMQRGEWTEAINSLLDQSNPELFYLHSPNLITHAAVALTNAWIQCPFLNPRRLIPAIMRFSPDSAHASSSVSQPKAHQGVRYLQHCVRNLNNRDPLIHNYLVSLLVSTRAEKSLMQYLHVDAFLEVLDIEYAYRLCVEAGLSQACIWLRGVMHKYEEAVDAALASKDIELAKFYAAKPEDDEVLRKALWLKIAVFAIEDHKTIKPAIEIMKESDCLKIEDILPHFPDFVVIDDFKEDICSALEEYSRHIDGLRRSMDEATVSADCIRKDIRELRFKATNIAGNQICEECNLPVLSTSLYVFPCLHAFHSNCLCSYVLSSTLDTAVRRNIERLELLTRASPDGPAAAELDDLIGSDCPLCGELMLKSLGRPFLTDADAIEAQVWQL